MFALLNFQTLWQNLWFFATAGQPRWSGKHGEDLYGPILFDEATAVQPCDRWWPHSRGKRRQQVGYRPTSWFELDGYLKDHQPLSATNTQWSSNQSTINIQWLIDQITSNYSTIKSESTSSVATNYRMLRANDANRLITYCWQIASRRLVSDC